MAPRSLTPASCPTCDAPLRIPNGAVHVDCVRCGSSFFLREANLVERGVNGGLWILGAGLLSVGAAIVAVGWMFKPEASVTPAAEVVFAPQEPSMVVVAPPVHVQMPPAPVPKVQVPPAPQVQVPPPVPQVQVPPPLPRVQERRVIEVGGMEPDYLRDPKAMAALHGRLHEATDWTGRVGWISIGPGRSVVAHLEVEAGFDSVVFSWGKVIVKPMAVADEDLPALKQALFTLSPDALAAVPAQAARALEGTPTGTEVENAMIRRGGDGPSLRLSRIHPRRVLEDVVVPLDAMK